MTTFEHAQKTIYMAMIKEVLKAHDPQNASDLLLNCGLPLKQVSYGQFRNVLEVVGSPYVIKVPSPGRLHKHNVKHAVDEFTAWKEIRRLRSHKAIRGYLPFFHWFDFKSGIAVMDMYKPVQDSDRRYDADITMIQSHLNECGFEDPDVGHSKKDNFGIDSEGNLKILDLGCFVKE